MKLIILDRADIIDGVPREQGEIVYVEDFYNEIDSRVLKRDREPTEEEKDHWKKEKEKNEINKLLKESKNGKSKT